AISFVNGTLTVGAKALTITANNASKIYGSSLTFEGTEFTVAGLTNSDIVTSVILNSSGTNAAADVGTYSITATNATGAGLSNYTITYNAGSLAVNAAALTITADNTNK